MEIIREKLRDLPLVRLSFSQTNDDFISKIDDLGIAVQVCDQIETHMLV